MEYLVVSKEENVYLGKIINEKRESKKFKINHNILFILNLHFWFN